jgi:hypothetical protein
MQITMHVELTPAEAQYLAELLSRALAEARVEMHRTQTTDYRQQVHEEEELLRRLLAKLSAPPERAAG